MTTTPPLPAWRLPGGISTQTLAIVIDEVAKAFGLNKGHLWNRDRHPRVAWARQVAMSLAVDFSGMGDKAVGDAIKRNHSSVAYARKTVRNLSEAYPDLKAEIEKIKTSIRKRIPLYSR